MDVVSDVVTVIERRRAIFERWATGPDLAPAAAEGIRLVEQALEKLKSVTGAEQFFLADVIIASTRVWEARDTTPDGTPRFPSWVHARRDLRLTAMIRKDGATIKSVTESDVTLTPVPLDHPVVKHAVAELQKNKEVVNQISGVDVDLCAFVANMRVFSMQCASFSFLLNGLSGYDGSRSYLTDVLLRDDDVAFPSRLLQHEFMHNVSRYVLLAPEPELISPSKNAALKIRGEQVEGGDYYDVTVHSKHIPEEALSPFCLSVGVREIY